MPNYLDRFIEANAEFITTVLITPIVDYYTKNTEAEISETKFLEILNLPIPQNKTPQRNTQPLTPAGKRSRTAPSSDEGQCKWVFTKGMNMDKRCTGKAVENGYCSACKNKRGAGGSGRQKTSRAETKGPKGASGLSSTKSKPPPKEEDNDQITIVEFGVATDGTILYFEESTQLVIKPIDEGNDNYVIVGYCPNPQSKEKTLEKASDKKKAEGKKKLGFDAGDEVELDHLL